MMIKPKKLETGDKIAIVSPSWGGPSFFPQRYEAGKKQLMDTFGVEVVEMPHALKEASWIHNNPKARADDLMQAFEDPSISAIVTSIGGDDSIRLLPHLDLNIIKNNPKIFMGYSDPTILHFACFKAGLVSFYGPTILAGFAENGGIFPYMEQSVRKTIFSNEPIGEVPEADGWTVEFLDWKNAENQSKKRKLEKPLGRKVLQGSGIVSGPLIGGCIDVFPMLIGTELWPEKEKFKGAILFVETSEEAPPADFVKRVFRNLGVQGILYALNGLLIGRPGGNVENLTLYDSAIQEVVRDEFGITTLPMIAQMDFGHTDPMYVLPYGINCEIDCTNAWITLKEAACI